MRELVRYATLAPSSHNTQCWTFHLEPQQITIVPDFTRRCPIVDPDDHHLFVSLGCATENLVQAAAASGLRSDVHVEEDGRVRVTFESAPVHVSPLFAAIPYRQSARTPYDSAALSRSDLQALAQAGTGKGVRIIFADSPKERASVRDFVVAGNTAELSNPAFVDELRSWIRFNGADASASGDGLYSPASGNPALPRWLGRVVLGFVLSPKSDGDKYARLMERSGGIATFVSERNDRAQWVEVGRCFERFALQATALNIRTSMLNQAVEVAPLRHQFETSLGLRSGRADIVARFGTGPEMPRSLRRPVRAVLA